MKQPKNVKHKIKYIFPLVLLFLIGLVAGYIKHSNKAEPATTHFVDTLFNTPLPTYFTTEEPSLENQDIYTFFQGPKAWKAQRTWSGSWADLTFEGNKFGSFGCGLCCMANLYCTLSDYVCSPVDMYHYATEVSSYHPSYGYGAISWPAIASTLEKCGISCTLHKSTTEYTDFVADIQNSTGTILLISSSNPNSYWTNTGGHYVTIWNYNTEDDTVFLADSGSPTNNRKTVSLEDMFYSLKTSSSFQYLTTDGYSEEENQWKHNQISEEWVAP